MRHYIRLVATWPVVTDEGVGGGEGDPGNATERACQSGVGISISRVYCVGAGMFHPG